jgi:hypothetical protein
MKRDSLGIRSTIWIYSKLLSLYPVSFQKSYGREMALTFRDVCRRENSRYGLSGLISLWFEVFIDLASTVLQEHLTEVGMLTRRQSYIKVTGILGALGGALVIIVGIAITLNNFGNDVTGQQAALFVLAFLLIGVGTTGYFLAGRSERRVNAALGVMLFGALIGAVGPVLMVGDIGLGWILFGLGLLVQGAGLLLLGVTTRQYPGFMRPAWLPLVLGIALTAVMILGSVFQLETLYGPTIAMFGTGWVVLGLLLLSGNVRTDAQPPAVA